MTFWGGEIEHFSGENGALRWSILVGKQNHNVQKPSSVMGIWGFVINTTPLYQAGLLISVSSLKLIGSQQIALGKY